MTQETDKALFGEDNRTCRLCCGYFPSAPGRDNHARKHERKGEVKITGRGGSRGYRTFTITDSAWGARSQHTPELLELLDLVRRGCEQLKDAASVIGFRYTVIDEMERAIAKVEGRS